MTRPAIILLALLGLGATSAWSIVNTWSITPPDGSVGLTVTADTTTPAAAPLSLAAQDTAPSSCDVGDVSVVVTTLKVCTAADTWTTVGTQGCIEDAAACTTDGECCNFDICNAACVCSENGARCVTEDDCCDSGEVCADIGDGPRCVEL